MAENHVTLHEAIEIVSQLDLDDRLKLRHALDQMTGGSAEEDPEISFKRILLEKGIISEIRSPQKAAGAATRRPVPVKRKASFRDHHRGSRIGDRCFKVGFDQAM